MGNEFQLFVYMLWIYLIENFPIWKSCKSFVNELLEEKKRMSDQFEWIWTWNMDGVLFLLGTIGNFSTLGVFGVEICSDINIINYLNCFDPFIKRPFDSLIEGFMNTTKDDESSCSNRCNAT